MTKICHLDHNVLRIDNVYLDCYQIYNLIFDSYNMLICELFVGNVYLNFDLILDV